MASFAHEIHDGPVILPLLEMVNGEMHEFRSPQPASDKHAEYGAVSLAAQSGSEQYHWTKFRIANS
jgi:hypothetical protein